MCRHPSVRRDHVFIVETAATATITFASRLATIWANGEKICRQQMRLNNAFFVLPHWSIDHSVEWFFCLCKQRLRSRVTSLHTCTRMARCDYERLISIVENKHINFCQRFPITGRRRKKLMRKQYRHTWTMKGMTPGQRRSIWNHLVCAFVPSSSRNALSTCFDFSW